VPISTFPETKPSPLITETAPLEAELLGALRISIDPRLPPPYNLTAPSLDSTIEPGPDSADFETPEASVTTPPAASAEDPSPATRFTDPPVPLTPKPPPMRTSPPRVPAPAINDTDPPVRMDCPICTESPACTATEPPLPPCPCPATMATDPASAFAELEPIRTA
jgi:hypothetical protein